MSEQRSRNRVRITTGPHMGAVGVVIDRDPKWMCVRISDGVWPFPREVWVHRRDCVPLADDRLSHMPEALV